MPVMTAEYIQALSKAERRNPGDAPPAPQPRDRRLPPNPSAAGGTTSARARMPYYIAAAEPVALQRRPVKPLPKSGGSSTTLASSSSDSLKQELPQGSYTEYTLMSTAPDDWKHSIMTFRPANRDTKVDIRSFVEPIRLNRKNPKSVIYADMDPKDLKQAPLEPMRGPDGQPVFFNGEMLMVNAEGQTSVSAAKAKTTPPAKGKGKATDPNAPPAKKKGPNKPKTRQTFKASDAVRARRKEEYHPWVMEDDTGSQEWIGTMDGLNDDGIYGLMTISEKGFQFIPVHRFYNFKPKRQITASVRAEEAHEKFTSGKRFNMVAEFAARNGGKVSDATRRTQAKVEKMAVEEMKPFIKREQGGGGGDDDEDLFGDGGRKRDMEGDIDEVEYEEDMADDDEGDRHEEMAEDEDEKRTQERLKKEYLSANKTGSQTEESDDDLDFEEMLNADGKRLKSVLKKAGEFDDESDEEEDYYGKRYGGAKKEEEEDSTLPIATGIQEQPRKGAKAPTPVPAPAAASTPKLANPAASTRSPKSDIMIVDTPASTPSGNTKPARGSVPPADRARNAAHPSPRVGSPTAPPSGAALIALRATSPKRPNVPISRATSPVASRTMSPLAGDGARATSPPAAAVAPANAATINAKKRKDAPASAAPQPIVTKKKKPTPTADASSSSIASNAVPIPTVADVIQFIRSSGGRVSAKDLAVRFKTKDSKEVKQALITLVKQVGKMEMGEDKVQQVTLKPGYG